MLNLSRALRLFGSLAILAISNGCLTTMLWKKEFEWRVNTMASCSVQRILEVEPEEEGMVAFELEIRLEERLVLAGPSTVPVAEPDEPFEDQEHRIKIVVPERSAPKLRSFFASDADPSKEAVRIRFPAEFDGLGRESTELQITFKNKGWGGRRIMTPASVSIEPLGTARPVTTVAEELPARERIYLHYKRRLTGEEAERKTLVTKATLTPVTVVVDGAVLTALAVVFSPVFLCGDYYGFPIVSNVPQDRPVVAIAGPRNRNVESGRGASPPSEETTNRENSDDISNSSLDVAHDARRARGTSPSDSGR